MYKQKFRWLVVVNTNSQSKFISLARASMKNEIYFTHVLLGSYVPLVVVISYMPIGVQRFDQSLLYQSIPNTSFLGCPMFFVFLHGITIMVGRVLRLPDFLTSQDNVLHIYSSILMGLFCIFYHYRNFQARILWNTSGWICPFKMALFLGSLVVSSNKW